MQAPTPCPILYTVLPCCNEEEVLPRTAPLCREVTENLIAAGKISPESRILLVDDGSRDGTWNVIRALAAQNPIYRGISLSRRRGQQNALLAGLTEACPHCDITVTADCDGQDDFSVIGKMVDAYLEGCDVVYGVRSDRDTDSFAKRTSARMFYRILTALGVESVYDHADCRLLSRRALEALLQFREVHLYLRGIVPLIGFKSTAVEYRRGERLAGRSHYPPGEMLALAWDAVTGLSVRPLRIISFTGFLFSLLSAVGIVWSVMRYFTGNTVSGWASTVCIVCFVSGVQLCSIGVLGEYIGRIYMEVKARPRYFIADRTDGE